MLVHHLLLLTGYFFIYFNCSHFFHFTFFFFKFVSWWGFMVSLCFGRPLWPREWLLGFGFPTITVEPVGIMLADRRQTFCPRANTVTLKQCFPNCHNKKICLEQEKIILIKMQIFSSFWDAINLLFSHFRLLVVFC